MVKGSVDELLRLALHLPTDGAADGTHPKGVDQHLGCIVSGAVVHHDDLVYVVIQGQQGADGLHHRQFLVIRRNDDSDRDIVVLLQNVFQPDLLLGLIQGGRAHHHRQEQEGGIPDQIENEENADAVEKHLDGVHQSIHHTNASSCSRRAFFRSIRYCRISLAYRSLLSITLLSSR